MKNTCKLEVQFPDAKSAKAAQIAISHEGNLGERSKSTVKLNNEKLEIIIDSLDTISSRATLNAYLRALSVFESINLKEKDLEQTGEENEK